MQAPFRIPYDGGYGGARSQEAEPPSDPGYPPFKGLDI